MAGIRLNTAMLGLKHLGSAQAETKALTLAGSIGSRRQVSTPRAPSLFALPAKRTEGRQHPLSVSLAPPPWYSRISQTRDDRQIPPFTNRRVGLPFYALWRW